MTGEEKKGGSSPPFMGGRTEWKNRILSRSSRGKKCPPFRKGESGNVIKRREKKKFTLLETKRGEISCWKIGFAGTGGGEEGNRQSNARGKNDSRSLSLGERKRTTCGSKKR